MISESFNIYGVQYCILPRVSHFCQSRTPQTISNDDLFKLYKIQYIIRSHWQGGGISGFYRNPCRHCVIILAQEVLPGKIPSSIFDFKYLGFSTWFYVNSCILPSWVKHIFTFVSIRHSYGSTVCGESALLQPCLGSPSFPGQFTAL